MYRCDPEPRERWISASVAVAGMSTPLLVLALVVYLGVSAGDALVQLPVAELMSTRWLPLAGHFGLAPLVLGTLSSTLAAMALAVPVGVAAALYLSLHAGPRVRPTVDACLALLGAIPSVILGLWGLTWIVPRLGHTLASAALVLALMILPTFTLLAGAALRQVPADVVEALRALGVGEGVVAWQLLRHARSGVLGAGVLATTRGLGEAVALSMVAGNVGAWPALDGPIATLTTTLIVEFDGATGLHRGGLHVAALLVLVLIGGFSLLGRALYARHPHEGRR